MTAKQAAVWELYAGGHGPAAIARALGLKSRGSVLSTIKKIKAEIQNPVVKERLYFLCIYSPSCFTCPLKDCGIDQARAARFNVLPADLERR